MIDLGCRAIFFLAICKLIGIGRLFTVEDSLEIERDTSEVSEFYEFEFEFE